MSNDTETDPLIVVIDNMFHEIRDTLPNPSICRVNDSLRSTSKAAYDPMVVSIGPLHHGKGHLKDMQNHKKRFLKKLVGESNVGKYVKSIRVIEKAARACYAEELSLEEDEFVQMLLLDAAFIIQYLDPQTFVDFGHQTLIFRDLLLLENQIPLPVLKELFDLSNNNGERNFTNLIKPFLSPNAPLPEYTDNRHPHLLGLVHYAITSSFCEAATINPTINNIRSASELNEVGLVFKKADKNKSISWLDIKYKKKTLYIPELLISDVTESNFRNMIAYECNLPRRHFSDYAFFLHCLIQSSNDAELLRRKGIISNWLGGDARVYEMVERLGTHAQPSNGFSYEGLFRKVNDHYGRKRNKWVAILRRTHLNNPWTIISLVAGLILLSVSIVQMALAISRYRSNDT